MKKIKNPFPALYDRIKNLKFFIYIQNNVKNTISFVSKKRRENTEIQYNLTGNYLTIKKTFLSYLYRIFILTFLSVILILFRNNVIFIFDSFFNLFRIKKIFRLDSFNGFLLLKAVNIIVIVAVISIIISILLQTINWFGTKIIITDNELIFHEVSFFSFRSERILFKSISRVSIKTGLIQDIFGTGNLILSLEPQKSKIEIKNIGNVKKISKNILSNIKINQ